MTTLRRSSRARQQSTSIYDDARLQQQLDAADHQGNHSQLDKVLDRESEDSSSSSSDEASDDESDHSNSGDDVDDPNTEFAPSTKKRKFNNGAASPATMNFASTPKSIKKVTPKKVRVNVPPSDSRKKLQSVELEGDPSSYWMGGSHSSNASSKSSRSALAALSKKYSAFYQEENKNEMNNSLVHQLLNIYKQPKHTSTHLASMLHVRKIGNSADHSSEYTPYLHGICRSIIQLHNRDPNKAQIQLINLIFRAVGGSPGSTLKANEVNLEEIENQEWSTIVTNLVDDMRGLPLDLVLVCADPLGATHARDVDNMMSKAGKTVHNAISMRNVSVPLSSLGVREFRQIYEEFWYVLAHTALEEGTMSMMNSSDDDGDDADQVDTKMMKKKTHLATRYDTEATRNILSRISELVSVGQPDIRSATTTAALVMSQAILDKTVQIKDKIDTATRQLNSASDKSKRSTMGTDKKVEALKIQVDSLTRTKADLEEIVEAMVIKGIFIHRYRDSDMFIRQFCMQALADFICIRPDLFMCDKYLKYFGWMMSDKAEIVRIAALVGLNRPFGLVIHAKEAGIRSNVDLSNMTHVVTKFLGRIVDCSIDVHVSVQEAAMKLLLSLLRNSFLDDVEDEHMWSKINTLAFDEKGSNVLRRDALYFIMEQLEEFDDKEKDDNNKPASSSDRRSASQLDAIASWAAHTLTDGNVPIDKIKIHLVDYIVISLRSMSDHKSLATNWNAMVRAITDDKVAITSQGESAGDRADVAKQRVLVQMLACAARLEVESVASSDFLNIGIDIDEVGFREHSDLKTKKKSSKSSELNHENLSIAIMKALPRLLDKFKSDSVILQSLVDLPRCFVQSIFSLPQRKNDFLALLIKITDIYVESTSETVLVNSARSIAFLCDGNHARSNDAYTQVTKLVAELRDRICSHISNSDSKQVKKSKFVKNNRHPALESTPFSYDEESALCNNLDRARILSKKFDFASLLGDDFKSAEDLCSYIVRGLTERLNAYQVARPIDDDATVATCKERWKVADERMVHLIPYIIRNGLAVILNFSIWRTRHVLEDEGILGADCTNNNDGYVTDSEDENMVEDANDHELLRLRNRLISLVELCYDQFAIDEEDCMPLQIQYSNSIIEIAAEVGCDIRMLFMKEYVHAKSPLLRSLAITDDSRLVGGYARFIRSKENELRQMGSIDKDEIGLDRIRSLLLPICRSIATNWKLGNRREAGIVLSHIIGSGPQVSEIVSQLSKDLKHIDNMRLLESHMASLRQSYEDWLDNDPSELEDENPTDEMMARYEEEEQLHKKQFDLIAQQAQRFSQSLGVRKLSNEQLIGPILLGFIREGIRFAFSESDEFLLGSRLSFLTIITKYAHWIRNNKQHQIAIRDFLHEKEMELRCHGDFEDVHEDDLLALLEFRKAVGLGESSVLNADASTFADGTSNCSGDQTPYSNGIGFTPGTGISLEDDAHSGVKSKIELTASTKSASRANKKVFRHSSESARSIMSSSVSNSLNCLEEVDEEDDNPDGYESRSESEDGQSPVAKSKRSRKSYSSLSESASRTYLETQTTFDGEAYPDSDSEY